jgi:hypothetical protein
MRLTLRVLKMFTKQLAMGVRLATPTTNDFVHVVLNQAWEEFWRNPGAYVEWEKKAVEKLREYTSRVID